MSITVFVKHGDDQFVSVHVHLDSYVGDLVHASITVLRLAVDPGKVSLRFLLDEVGTGGAILDPTARLSAACVYNESRLIVEVKPSLVGFRGRSGGGAGGEGSSAGLKRSHDYSVSSWHDANPLVHTSGRAWAYQPSPLNATKIARGLADLSTAWSTASLDKSVRPVFTIASGPGTGKSRLLDELPRLCCASAAASSPSLASSLKRAFIFKVSFENGTPYDAAAEAALDGDSLIGTRMKWQLTDSTTTSYSAFQSRSPCTIEDALDDLSAISHIPRDKQFVFLIVDGLQKLLPVQIARSAAPLDPVKFRSAINAVSACVNSFPECIVGAIAATLAIPIREAFGVFSHGGSQQARIYLEPPPLFRPADVVPDIPEMPLLGVLRDDMGGHGRALELLASSLYTFGTDELRPFSSVATSVIAGLSSKFEEWTSAAGVKQLWEPLLNAVIARRRLALSDVVPGTEWTVDRVRSLGLVRFVTADTASGLSASGYLDMAVALLQVIRAELRPGPLTTLVPDYAFMESTSRVAKSWQDFEDLVANFRAIKVAAFQDMAQVSLSELHAGAKLSAVAAATVVRVPSGPNVAVRVLHPTTRYSTATFRLDANSFDVIGRVDEEPAALRDVVLNGVSASAGDIFLRLDRLERSSGKFIPELEVLACRHRQADVNAMAFDEELYKAFGDRRSTSFFLFVTSARVQVDLGAADLAKSEGDGHGSASAGYQTRSFSLGSPRIVPAQRRAGELVGYIDASCFEAYFGSFAGRVFHLLRSIPPIDVAVSGGAACEESPSGGGAGDDLG